MRTTLTAMPAMQLFHHHRPSGAKHKTEQNDNSYLQTVNVVHGSSLGYLERRAAALPRRIMAQSRALAGDMGKPWCWMPGSLPCLSSGTHPAAQESGAAANQRVRLTLGKPIPQHSSRGIRTSMYSRAVAERIARPERRDGPECRGFDDGYSAMGQNCARFPGHIG